MESFSIIPKIPPLHMIHIKSKSLVIKHCSKKCSCLAFASAENSVPPKTDEDQQNGKNEQYHFKPQVGEYNDMRSIDKPHESQGG